MKKLIFILAALIGAVMISGCEKDREVVSEQETTESEVEEIRYAVNRSYWLEFECDAVTFNETVFVESISEYEGGDVYRKYHLEDGGTVVLYRNREPIYELGYAPAGIVMENFKITIIDSQKYSVNEMYNLKYYCDAIDIDEDVFVTAREDYTAGPIVSRFYLTNNGHIDVLRDGTYEYALGDAPACIPLENLKMEVKH